MSFYFRIENLLKDIRLATYALSVVVEGLVIK